MLFNSVKCASAAATRKILSCRSVVEFGVGVVGAPRRHLKRHLWCGETRGKFKSTSTTVTMDKQAEAAGDSAASPSRSQHLQNEEIARGKWISLNEITYKDPTGKERKWEAVYRTTKIGDGADAVVMIPILKESGKKDRLILVKQYRPPLKAYTIEFPAGLIDKGESAYDCAVRELREETGYVGVPKDNSPGVCLDPGLASSTVNIVTLEINGDLPENTKPDQQQEESEFIEVFKIPAEELFATLNKFSSDGDCVHCIVYTYALVFAQMAKSSS